MTAIAMTVAGPTRRLRRLIMFVPPNGLNTCWLSRNELCVAAGSEIPPPLRRATRRFIPRESAGLSRRWRDFRSGAVRGGLLVDKFGDAQQQVAAGLGSDRIAKAPIRPVESSNAAIFMIAERRLVTDACAKIQSQPIATAVLIHQLGSGSVLGWQQSA